MKTKPTVSVIVPTYNGEKYLEEALVSVFAQTYNNYELIVVDDGSSTSGVADICGKYRDKLRYIRQDNNGQASARNNGIMQCHGEYVAFLDDDDIWLPDKLQKQVSCYARLRDEKINAGLVYTGHQFIDEDYRVISNVLYKSAGNNYRKLLFIDFIGTPSSVMVPRFVLDDVGLFDKTICNTEDYDMWLRIGKKYEIYSVNEILIRYRNVRNSVSKNVSLKIANTNKVIEKNIQDGLLDKEIDEAVKCRLMRRYNTVAAMRYKNSAYEHLILKKDGKKFREFIMKGYSIDRSLFGFKVLAYYLISYVSAALCGHIKNMMKREVENIIIDVNDMKF
jgi:glycosyltransferase involved in cell wall biosynthesis